MQITLAPLATLFAILGAAAMLSAAWNLATRIATSTARIRITQHFNLTPIEIGLLATLAGIAAINSVAVFIVHV